MLRKILFGALTLLLALSLVGCGAKKDDAGKKDEAAQKTEEKAAPQSGADKAILAYAQLYAYGIVSDENKAATNLQQADIDKVQAQVLAPVVDTFKQYPLSDESVAEMAGKYVAKLQSSMNIETKVKTEDKANPVVELTVTTLDREGASKVIESDEDLVALGAAYGELQAQGLTADQLKGSPEFQQFALESIDKFIGELPLKPASSIDVTCEIVEGSDGKTYWAPKDADAVAKFVSGQ